MREFKDSNDDDCGSLGLGYFASFQNLIVDLDRNGASAAEVEEVEAALRRAADVHPNRPTLEMRRFGEKEMVSTTQDQEVLLR